MNNIETICISSSAFYALLDSTIDHIDAKYGLAKEPLWIDSDEAMKLLHVQSRTTLGEIRDSGAILFSKVSSKIILYNRQSILDFIDSKKQTTF